MIESIIAKIKNVLNNGHISTVQYSGILSEIIYKNELSYITNQKEISESILNSLEKVYYVLIQQKIVELQKKSSKSLGRAINKKYKDYFESICKKDIDQFIVKKIKTDPNWLNDGDIDIFLELFESLNEDEKAIEISKMAKQYYYFFKSHL